MDLIFFEARSVSHSLSALINEHGIKEQQFEAHSSLKRYILTCLWLFGATVLIFVAAFGLYVIVLSRVLFFSLLIWRGFDFVLVPCLQFILFFHFNYITTVMINKVISTSFIEFRFRIAEYRLYRQNARDRINPR